VLEILVVIALVLFLLGVLIMMAANARRQSQIAATKALIQTIAIGMEQYNAKFNSYPPDTGFGLPRNGSKAGVTYDPGSIWRYLCRPVVDARTGNTLDLQTNIHADNLVAYNDPVHGPSYYVVDVWGNPIGFTSDRRRVNFNLSGFDLFSPGPDKVTASDDGIDNGRFFNAPNTAYDGAGSDDASELGEAALNGTLPDDLNNWSAK